MLQFITHTYKDTDTLAGAEAVLQGGCCWVQLRMKDADSETIVDVGRQLRKLCDRYGAKLILDDYVDLVLATDADGVHLGKNDMPVADARKILGADKIIGATANTFEDIAYAKAAGADYIGLGPFRFTETKKKLSPVLGLEGYRSIMQQCADASISLPVVAIGGITIDDIPALMTTGISGVAVSGSLLRAENPVEETKKFINALKQL